jgi:hypothetical protein
MPLQQRARRDDKLNFMTVQKSLDQLAFEQDPSFNFYQRPRRDDPYGHMVVQENLEYFRDQMLGVNTNPFPKRARRDDPNGAMVVQEMLEYLERGL